MAATGTYTADFGATPVDSGTFTVTEATCTAESFVEAFGMVDSTAGNDTGQHRIAAASLRLSCEPAAGSFTLNADALFGLVTGEIKLRYVVA